MTATYERPAWPHDGAAPRWATPRSPERPTYGPNVGKVAASLEQLPMPWQQYVLDVSHEVLPDGSWAYQIVVVTVQRQAGKTTLIAAVQILRGIIKRGCKMWLTAQTRQDARDIWMDIANLVRRKLKALVKVRESNGSEAIANRFFGSTFRPFAPKKDGLHGKANELVFVDEGWAFNDVQGSDLDSAILPTFTTTGGQLWVLSAAGTADSAYLMHLVDVGRAAVARGDRTGIAYFEWSLPEELVELVTAGIASDATEEQRAAAFAALLEHHPGHGYTLREDALDAALRKMKPGDFLRAYGNVWTQTSERKIPEHVWEACRVKRSEWTPPPAPPALAFDVALDRSSASIAAAWRPRPGAPVRVEVVWNGAPSALLGELRRLQGKWGTRDAIGYDAFGPALDIADELEREGLALQPLKAREYAAACAGFLAACVDARLTHCASTPLDDAVANAAAVPYGDAWKWSRRDSAGSIAPLGAATCAVWTYDHTAPPLPPPMVVRARRRVQ